MFNGINKSNCLLNPKVPNEIQGTITLNDLNEALKM